MNAAIAAYTPNIPWPLFGCPEVIRLNGEGTSAATPQVAAAAALWLEKYKHQLPQDWRRVEAVRHALFHSAARHPELKKHFGNGLLRARDALTVKPQLDRPPSARSRHTFALFRLITGLGVDTIPTREHMFNLELAQLCLRNPTLADAVTDLAQSDLPVAEAKKIMEAIIEDQQASLALRQHVVTRYPVVTRTSPPDTPAARDVLPRIVPSSAAVPDIASPPYRRLRVYAVDPSFAAQFETASVNEVTLQVRWEQLGRAKRPDQPNTPEPGSDASPVEMSATRPVPAQLGEYFLVDDIDPTDRHYGLVDLDAPALIATDGWAPSEGNPHFHQQMVYAVALRTVSFFEKALGRRVLWRATDDDEHGFRPRLILRPHALQQANAFYSPDQVALLFGYFDAAADTAGQWPGAKVFSCLSYDIIAHETTHAILDGMYRRYNEPTNPDVLALHEAFADIVALLQHFTLPELLEHQINKAGGNLEADTMLGSLAVQFGRASGRGGALRDAIGRHDQAGTWVRRQPDPNQYRTVTTPHARGAILVAAVFDAFLTIYRARSQDLFRLATGGTGIMPAGALHPDLVRRLTDEATKAAGHVLNMAIRALDYLPPVDVTFFDYLRALITADYDLVRDDRFNYRVAFVEAFRRHGIHPDPPAPDRPSPPVTMSVDTLRWHGLDPHKFTGSENQLRRLYRKVCGHLQAYADAAVYLTGDRAKLADVTTRYRTELHALLADTFTRHQQFATELGVSADNNFEIEELRRVTRVTPEGRLYPQVVVTLTQTTQIHDPHSDQPIPFRSGTTWIVDLITNNVRYSIGKGMHDEQRKTRATAYVTAMRADPLRNLYLNATSAEPFAALHTLTDPT